jgi:16S rRNA (cytosine1407-C5)-methyltransferase
VKKNSIPLSENITTYLGRLYGDDWIRKYTEYIGQSSVDHIRYNSCKTTKEQLIASLREGYAIELEEVPGFPFALRVVKDENRNLGKTIEHITGNYYIQSLSSMLPPLVMDPQPGERVLDLCAAPGSKTTMLAQMMQNEGSLVANEIQHNRAGILTFNIERMTAFNTAVLKMPGEQIASYYPEFFDKILVDAPCSGLGIIQKKGEVSSWWNEELIKKLTFMQYKLLVSAIKALKEGGTLVYSTCTLTVEENEEMLQTILDAYPVSLEKISLPLETAPGFTAILGKTFSPDIAKSCRLDPLVTGSEGFFVAKLVKTESMDYRPKHQAKTQPHKFTVAPVAKKALGALGEQFGIPAEILFHYDYHELHSDLFIVSKGWDGGFFTPHSRLGLKFGALDKYGNLILHTNGAQILEKHFTKRIIECDSPDEVKIYLDGGTIRRPEFSGEKGQAVLRHRGRILGTGVYVDGGFKSRFPRALRTQTITMANTD